MCLPTAESEYPAKMTNWLLLLYWKFHNTHYINIIQDHVYYTVYNAVYYCMFKCGGVGDGCVSKGVYLLLLGLNKI